MMSSRGGKLAATGGAGVVIALLTSGVLYPNEALGAVRVWIDSPTFNHCFLVLPISLFMIWQRRDALSDANIVPDWRAVIAILTLSVLWLAASVVGVLEARQFVVMTMVQAALVGSFGAAFYRKLAAPFLYLYFLVPTGAYLIPALQAFTAAFAVAGLHILHIPVYSNGAVIEIPAGTFAVAEACAGLRFLVAAIAFGVFFAVITYRSWLRRALFIALSVVVPIIANGFRALGLIAAAEWIGSAQAALADHILYGWIFFSAVLVLLICIGQLFSDRHESFPTVPARPIPLAKPFLCSRILFSAVLCLLAAATAPLAASLSEAPRPLNMPRQAPRVAASWRKLRSASDWQPVVMGPTVQFSEAFAKGPYKIDRFIALYGSQGPRNNLMRSNDRDADERMWTYVVAKGDALTIKGQSIGVRVSTWSQPGQKRMVWSFYIVNGHATSSIWSSKWSQLAAWLTGSQCVPAYVALSMVVSDEVLAKQAVEGLLDATEPLNSYLCRPLKGRARQ
ncbi:MAG TPA: exosortase A [Rhizomicrobium sp.]|jgi:exosortase A|nr:exosortase A [Rhizomicrobium sp.]